MCFFMQKLSWIRGIEGDVIVDKGGLDEMSISNCDCSIHSELLSLSNDGITVYRAIPNLVLYSPECCANAPIISVAWCEYNGGAQFAGISAAGNSCHKLGMSKS